MKFLQSRLLAPAGAAILFGSMFFHSARPATAQSNEKDDSVKVSVSDDKKVEIAKARIGATTLAYPTGVRETSVLLIEANVPESAKVGQQYSYPVKITNLTEHLGLEDIRLHYHSAGALQIVKTSGDTQQQKQQQNQKQKQDKQNENQQGQKQQSQTSSSGGSQEGDQSGNIVKVKSLGPGESATLEITAVGEKQGVLAHCIGVDYRPVLCMATKFVEPELRLTKSAPERIDLCDTITFTYTVTNSGTGATEMLTLTDPLPEGLKTSEGKSEISMQIQPLKPGESRKVQVQLVAERTGNYSSRAQVASKAGLTASSSKPTTEVVAPALALEASGPNYETIGDPLDYIITITNKGDSTAENVILAAELAKNFQLIRSDKPYQEGDVSITWNLGTLEPSQAIKVWIRTTATEPGKMAHGFAVAHDCGKASKNVAGTSVTTELIAVPALLVTAVDNRDPIEVGEEFLYNITLANQGSGVGKNIQIVAQLPKEVKFVDVSGPTDAKNEGNKITLDKLDQLPPGEVVQWQITAKAEKVADTRLRVELTSDYLKEPVVAMEPTRLYSTKKGVEGSASSNQTSKN